MKKTALFLAFVLMLSAVLLSCSGKKTNKKEEDPEENNIVIAENGKCNYKIIYPDNPAPWEKEVALYIRDTIEYYSGSDVEIATDWALSKDEIDPNTKEILVGNTNRQESQDVKKSITVAAHDNKIVVRGITRNSMYYAAGIFVSQYIKNSENMLVSIPKNLCVEETVEKADGWALDAMPVMDGVEFGALTAYNVHIRQGIAILIDIDSLIDGNLTFQLFIRSEVHKYFVLQTFSRIGSEFRSVFDIVGVYGFYKSYGSDRQKILLGVVASVIFFYYV